MIKNLIIFGGLLLLGVFGYYLFFLKETTTSGITSGTTDIAVVAEREAFLRSLQELKSIDLDTAVLNDPRFMSLTNYGFEPEQVSVGRQNTFAQAN